MNKKWKEFSVAEKIVTVFTYIFGAAALVMFIVEIVKGWEGIYGGLGTSFVSVAFFGESLMTWKNNRTASIINILCGVALLGIGIATIVMNLK